MIDADPAAAVDDVLDEIGTAPMSDRDEQREAVVAALRLLEDGPMQKKEFINELHDDHPAGYSNARTWWRRVIKPVLKEHPDVVTPQGGNPWQLRE